MMMRKRSSVLVMAVVLCACSGRSSDLQPLSHGILETLAFQTSELPPGYGPVAPTNFLATMGMERNPDFICNRTELETIGSRGGFTPFIGVYGHDNQIRLMLNGVYFRHESHARDFIRVQQEKERCVAAYIRTSGQGAWVLLYARDPDVTYGEAERTELQNAITRHARRVDAEMVYSTLWTNAAL